MDSQARGSAPSGSHSATSITCTVRAAIESGCRVLARVGVAETTARLVMLRLLRNELAGYKSHGLLRLPEYARGVASGMVSANGEPSITRHGSGSVWRVDGQRSFGVLVGQRLVEALPSLMSSAQHSVCGLVNCGHLGRLHDLLVDIADQGFAVLAFVNYQGGGQRVAPPGGSGARLATSPLGFGMPRVGHDPLIVDFSSSVVAEGRIRSLASAGESLPPDWLIDDAGASTDDPQKLYASPPRATMAPLGYPNAAHKGFLLSLMIEILVGAIVGAGVAAPARITEGNGAFLLVVRPSMFGRSAEEVSLDVEQLLGYITSSPNAGPGAGPRLPRVNRIDPHDHLDQVIVLSDSVRASFEQHYEHSDINVASAAS